MNSNLIAVCLILLTAAALACAVYLILALIQIKRASKELEEALKKVNTELEYVNKISGKVADITDKISSPVMSAASLLFYAISGIKERRKNRRKEQENVR
ncbi:MAG: hypothetical protein FWC57_02155 [Endomicrobia bacterium]|nr:hypothetical protein [Endomicrobiia bacterium]